MPQIGIYSSATGANIRIWPLANATLVSLLAAHAERDGGCGVDYVQQD